MLYEPDAAGAFGCGQETVHLATPDGDRAYDPDMKDILESRISIPTLMGDDLVVERRAVLV